MLRLSDIQNKGLHRFANISNKVGVVCDNMNGKFSRVVHRHKTLHKKLYEYHKVLEEISACLGLDFYNIQFDDLMKVLRLLKGDTTK